MAFWRSETLKIRLPDELLIEPYQPEQVQHSAYELRMGNEAFVTSTGDQVKIELAENQSIAIPPGQFALLLTSERVKVPTNAIAFISMRFKVKRRGLVNVSGFHVDPGFKGRLKFSVYNAGSSPISITRGDRLFLIWYASLDGETADGYGDAGPAQDSISSEDQNVMHGEIASPAQLKLQLDSLKHFDVHRKWMLGVIAAALLGILIRLVFMNFFAVPSSHDIERMRQQITNELREELVDSAPPPTKSPNKESLPDNATATSDGSTNN